MELRRPLPVLKESFPVHGAVVLAGPEGVIELKPLSVAVARSLVAAGQRGDVNAPARSPHVKQQDSDASAIPGVQASVASRAFVPPHTDESAGSQERVFRARTIRTWQDAELAAVDHMRSLGFTDARVTGAGADGGIDVIARDAIAQVKHYAQPIGVGFVRELRGVADSHQHLLFYASGGYTKSAQQFADERRVALFSIHELGNITPLNTAAADLSSLRVPAAGRSRTISSRNQAASGRRQAPNPRASRRTAELEAQRQTVLRLITRVRAHTNELDALPSNRHTRDLIKALKAAHKLAERANSLLAKSQADFQTHGTRKRLIAMADEKAREAALKLRMRT
ncbi:restriction endonuclease [Streptomyces canus]|uniref:restriction endonuclease n=1 Tax=Streptomyces canus TaxID=58343 RepID=UPI002E2F40D1|nr:restriction endonuclease [Streptomyces canus]